jgi:hypothetical protein
MADVKLSPDEQAGGSLAATAASVENVVLPTKTVIARR